jgi:hypothetical protein
MLIDDLVGEDVDPALAGALVVFNAGTEPTTQTVEALQGRSFALTPALANGSDPVVKTTTWNTQTATVTVPARSVAVLVEREPVATHTVVAPTKFAVRSGTTVPVVGKVIAEDGSAAVGTVTVTDNGKVVATVELEAAARGRVTIGVPVSGRGVHLIRATFAGADRYDDSRSPVAVPVLVY